MQAPAIEDLLKSDVSNFKDNFEDLDLELDGEQEQIWEQSMSQIITEMKVQLQRDLIGQPSTDETDTTPLGEVMDRFFESEHFEQALAYKGGLRKRKV